MIARRRVLLLIRRLLLLVHNDQPQSGKRQKQRRTYSHYRQRLVGLKQLIPHLHPFRVREPGMIHQQTLA